jgi:hypothetical protein
MNLNDVSAYIKDVLMCFVYFTEVIFDVSFVDDI